MLLVLAAACSVPFDLPDGLPRGPKFRVGMPWDTVVLAEVGASRLEARCEPDDGQLLLEFELPGTTRCRRDVTLTLGGLVVPDLPLVWRDCSRGLLFTDHSLHVLGLTPEQEAALRQAATVRVECSGRATTFPLVDVTGRLASCPPAAARDVR